MSAFGTKKRGGDKAVQLTFPDVLASEVAETGGDPYGYVAGVRGLQPDLPFGQDLQSMYHRQKQIDANRSAMNGVHNQRRSDWLLLHNTYGYTQPKPLLGQRVYANPSVGNQADIYSARPALFVGGSGCDDYSSRMEGGIARTRVAQNYVQGLRTARIAQLNTIDELKRGMPMGSMPSASASAVSASNPADAENIAGKIDLNAQLQSLVSIFEVNANPELLARAFDASIVKTAIEAEKLLFRLAVDFTREDFDDVLNVLNRILVLKRSALGDRDDRDPVANQAGVRGFPIRASKFAGRVGDVVSTMRAYAIRMREAVYRPESEKKIISRSLLKELGASRVVSPSQFQSARQRLQTISAPPPQPAQNVDVTEFAPNSGVPGTTASPPPYINPEVGRGRKRGGARPGKINLAVQSGAVRFDRDTRPAFGNRQGAYLGEQIGQQVPLAPVPIPVTPDGQLIKPGSGYVRPTFPRISKDRMPTNELKPRKEAPLPMFQDSAKGIFSAPRLRIPKADLPADDTAREGVAYGRGKSLKERLSDGKMKGGFPLLSRGRMVKLSDTDARLNGREYVPEGSVVSKSVSGLTRATLPKAREGFMELAEKLKGQGHNIRVNSGSQLKNIRANFIRKLSL